MGILKISAEKHILCYLWFVGHESGSYRDVADRFGITISSLYNIITRVTDFIMSLAPNVIRYPIPQEQLETSNYFLRAKGFPNVVGNVFVFLFMFCLICFTYVLLPLFQVP